MNVDKMEETNELYNIINSKFCGYFSEFYEGNKRIVNKLNISRIINKNKKTNVTKKGSEGYRNNPKSNMLNKLYGVQSKNVNDYKEGPEKHSEPVKNVENSKLGQTNKQSESSKQSENSTQEKHDNHNNSSQSIVVNESSMSSRAHIISVNSDSNDSKNNHVKVNEQCKY